ncbi:MAG: hypothetical protein IJ594_01915 [Oscillospiraceae bacterium]|nr:hypothetical protein [Oscillospiraceae bacterium]
MEKTRPQTGPEEPVRKKKAKAPPYFLLTVLLFLVLIVVCALNAVAIDRLQTRNDQLEEQLARSQSELQSAIAGLQSVQGTVTEMIDRENAQEYPPLDYDTVLRSVAHRGYSTEAPENTLPAFRMARKYGFSYVETDVQFTADGVAVCLHDNEIDRTSNGSGPIDTMTLEEVRQYDFGSWKGEEYAGTQIPTFEEFLLLCRSLGLRPYVELKGETVLNDTQIRQLVQTVNACGMSGEVTWISFSHYLLILVRQYDPTARLGYLVEAVNDLNVARATWLRNGTNYVFLDSCVYNDEACQLCMDNGVPLEIWTVDKETKITSLNPYITGVTTNRLIAGKIVSDAYIEQSEG